MCGDRPIIIAHASQSRCTSGYAIASYSPHQHTRSGPPTFHPGIPLLIRRPLLTHRLCTRIRSRRRCGAWILSWRTPSRRLPRARECPPSPSSTSCAASWARGGLRPADRGRRGGGRAEALAALLGRVREAVAHRAREFSSGMGFALRVKGPADAYGLAGQVLSGSLSEASVGMRVGRLAAVLMQRSVGAPRSCCYRQDHRGARWAAGQVAVTPGSVDLHPRRSPHLRATQVFGHLH